MHYKQTLSTSNRGQLSLRHLASGLLGGASLLVLSVPGSGQPAQGGACGQITAACERAGFFYGGVNSGNGLVVDCIQPIMQDKPQRPAAIRPLPSIDPQVVASCRASNPNFGQARATPPALTAPPHAASAPPLVPTGGGEFLDAESCGDDLYLNPSTDEEGGACQLWKLAPDTGGWSRVQLKYNGKYVDAESCKDDLYLNPSTDEEGGACQLWKLVPDTDGWSRMQLKYNGKYLAADDCTDITLSDFGVRRHQHFATVEARSRRRWLVTATDQMHPEHGTEPDGPQHHSRHNGRR